MRVFRSISNFYNGDSGSIAIFLVLILPLLIVLGGIATDISLINAQKKHVQARADIAAMSGIAFIEAPDRMLEVIREVDEANDRNNGRPIAMEDIVLGRFTKATGFRELEKFPPGTSPDAIEVHVTSPFRPMLLSAILKDENLNITRTAVATRSGNIIFSIRNRLLRLDTSKSALAALLQDTLGVQLNVLDSDGLLSSQISLKEVLGFIPVPLDADVNALTFRELLAIPIDATALLDGVFKTDVGGMSAPRLALGNVIHASGGLLDVRLKDMPPDLMLNVLDLTTAVVEFAGQGRNRVLRAAINQNVAGIANVKAEVGVGSGPVWAAGSTEEPLSATVEQVSTKVSANVGGVLKVGVDVAVGGAVAVLNDVSCVPSTSDGVVATFSAQTAPALIGLDVQLLEAKLIAKPQYGRDEFPTTPIGSEEKKIPIQVRASQIGEAIPIPNKITLSSLLISPIKSLVEGISDQLSDDKAACSNIVSCLVTGLVGSIFDLLSGVVKLLTDTLTLVDDLLKALPLGNTKLDDFLDKLLDELGINEAQAELIVHSISCGAPKLVQ